MKRRQVLSAALCTAAVMLAAGTAHAQEAFPNKPIRIVIGYAAGGGTDILARIITDKLSRGLGQSVIVENKPGAQSIIAAQYVAAAKPDGYTLFMGPSGPIAMNPAIYSKLPYSPLRDFAPISIVGSYPLVLVVSPNLPVKSVQDLVAYAKANPSKSNYGASAAPFQLAAELFKQRTGAHFEHIAYKGSNESVNAVMAGEVTMTIADPPAVAGPIKAGRIRGLAVTSSKRHPAWPDLPTLVDSGFPDMDIVLWNGFLAPAGTPAPVIKRLQEELARVMAMPDVRERFASLGVDPVTNTPEEFRKMIASDIEKWTAVAKAANIKAD